MDALPPAMAFFRDYRADLSDHATDPDQGNLPGYYHYIDIDAYPEFFTGTLPHEWDDFIAQYGTSTATDNGIVPWVIDWWMDSLSVLMKTGEWETSLQVAAELGHYVADAHNPLHLTLNYNGQNTGNNGIHSRYESQMVTPHLPEIPPPVNPGVFWVNPPDSIFQWIDVLYPAVAMIMAADDSAAAIDPAYATVYYDTMWSLLDSLTMNAIQSAIRDLASLWYTAWVRADFPVPVSSLNMLPGTIVIPSDYPTIQEGIAAAIEGEDKVLVLPGFYSENLDFMGKDIMVISSQGPLETTIASPDTGHVIRFTHQEGPGARLEGFTITGGGSFTGGGILCDSASPVIRYNIIRDNEAGWCGGQGAGIAAVNGSNPIIINNTITENDALGACDCICYFGGGIYIDGSSSPVIGGSPDHGNNIYANTGDYGRQLYRAGGTMLVTASYNYWGGDCPPDTVWDVRPGTQFNISTCQDTILPLYLELESPSIPVAYQLLNAYPNPFNSSVTLEYRITAESRIRLSIYDLNGRVISVLSTSVRAPGLYRTVWDGKDHHGRSVSSGLYISRLVLTDQILSRKLLLLK